MRFRLWVVLLVLLGLWTTASAQENKTAPFTFWVNARYANPFNEKAEFFLLNEQGQVLDSFDQYKAMDELLLYNYIISPNGKRFAVVGRKDVFSKDGFKSHYELAIYDTEHDQTIYDTVIDNQANASFYFIDDNTLVYSFRRNDDTWEIAVLDLASGTITHQLTDANLVTYELKIGANSFTPSPWIYSATSESILFAIIDRERKFQSFVWHYRTNSITYLDNYLSYPMELLSPNAGVALPIAGSPYVVLPKVDDRLLIAARLITYSNPYGYDFSYGNAVHILDITKGQYFPIFTTAEGVIERVFPVQNSERFLVAVAKGYQSLPAWILMERDGRVVETIFTGDMKYIFNTPDGFIFNSESFIDFGNQQDGTPERGTSNLIYAYNTRTMSAQGFNDLQAKYDINAFPQSPQIIWASASAPKNFGGFKPIMPILPTKATLTETIPMRVNGAAYVTMSGGETLNMRDKPSTDGEIVKRLQNNQRVILLDGPVKADGFTWWEVWAGYNVRGWIVQEVDGETTLRPPTVDRDQPLTMIEANLINHDTGFPPLSVGQRVRVVSDKANVRLQTGLRAEVSEVLLRNARMTIIGGSFEDDGLVWWRVQTDTGTQGWIEEVSAEGEIEIAPVK